MFCVHTSRTAPILSSLPPSSILLLCSLLFCRLFSAFCQVRNAFTRSPSTSYKKIRQCRGFITATSQAKLITPTALLRMRGGQHTYCMCLCFPTVTPPTENWNICTVLYWSSLCSDVTTYASSTAGRIEDEYKRSALYFYVTHGPNI